MSSDFRKVFGHKIKMVRKLHFDTQKDIGELLGKSKQTVCKYEQGIVPLTVEQLSVLLKHWEKEYTAWWFFKMGAAEQRMLHKIENCERCAGEVVQD